MNAMLELTRFADALYHALLHSLWQVSAAALVYWAARRTALSIGRRYALGCVLLLATAVAGVATFTRHYAVATPMVFEVEGNSSSSAPMIAAASEWTPAAVPVAIDWSTQRNLALLAVWFIGLSLVTARSLFALWALRVSTLRHASALPDDWETRARRLADELGVTRVVRFVASRQARVPFTFGWMRPVVVMPIAVIAELPADAVELLLRHELRHVLRRDFLVNVLQRAVEALLFYHPLLWWLSAQVRADRELVCDAEVVAGGADRLAYARALTELEALRSDDHESPSPALGADGGELMTRIQRVLSEPTEIRARAWGWAVAAGAALLGLCCGVTLPDPPDDQDSVAQQETALSIAWLPPAVSRHRELIETISHSQGVDADVVALMILVESGGDPRAQSPLGARGLMQLMPATARRVAERHAVPLGKDDALFDPVLNVTLGATLLRDLLDDFATHDRQLELALLAYNGGSRAVMAHLDAGRELPEEAQRYATLLLSLHAERSQRTSTTYAAWRNRVRHRMAGAARDPLPGGRVTSAFGERVDPLRGTPSSHDGIDIAHQPGTAVVAPLDGVVLAAGDSGDARGIHVVLQHRGQLETRFHHLASTPLKPGQQVAAGSLLGTVGNTGGSTGPHLHVELRDQGVPIDPFFVTR